MNPSVRAGSGQKPLQSPNELEKYIPPEPVEPEEPPKQYPLEGQIDVGTLIFCNDCKKEGELITTVKNECPNCHSHDIRIDNKIYTPSVYMIFYI